MFGTKGLDTAERSGVSRYLHHGIIMAKINSIIVEKAKSTDSKRVVFHLESPPINDKSFQGVDGAKGAIGKMNSVYMNSDKAYQDFTRQIGVMADKFGVRNQVDAVNGVDTIEKYMAYIAPLLIGKFAWWNIGADEYDKGKFGLKLLKYGFIKSLDEVDPTSLKFDGYIAIEAKNALGAVVLTFDKDDKYQFTAYKAPDSSFTFPSASETYSPPKFNSTNEVDELLFGNTSNNPKNLPY